MARLSKLRFKLRERNVRMKKFLSAQVFANRYPIAPLTATSNKRQINNNCIEEKQENRKGIDRNEMNTELRQA